jgi:hypothetical protein
LIYQYQGGIHPITVEHRKTLEEAVNGMENIEAPAAIEERLKSTDKIMELF